MRKNKDKTVKIILMALFLAVVAFGAVLYMESSILSKYDKKTVVIATKDVAKSTIITKDNKSEYFKEAEIPADIIIKNAYTSMDDIKECIVKNDIQSNEQLTGKKVIDVAADIISKYDEPVEVSLTVNDIANAVSGTLRKGDRVDIVGYPDEEIDTFNKNFKTILEDVYISGTYDANGTEVNMDSEAVSSIVFNFIIEKDDYISFLRAAGRGDVQLVKVSNLTE